MRHDRAKLISAGPAPETRHVGVSQSDHGPGTQQGEVNAIRARAGRTEDASARCVDPSRVAEVRWAASLCCVSGSEPGAAKEKKEQLWAQRVLEECRVQGCFTVGRRMLQERCLCQQASGETASVISSPQQPIADIT